MMRRLLVAFLLALGCSHPQAPVEPKPAPNPTVSAPQPKNKEPGKLPAALTRDRKEEAPPPTATVPTGGHQPGPPPLTLSRRQIQDGMKGVRRQVQICYDRYKIPGLANVRVRIIRDGSVQSAQTRGMFAGTPTGGCIETAVSMAQFGRFTGTPIVITYPFVLR